MNRLSNWRVYIPHYVPFSDGDHTQNKTKVTQYGRNANFGKQNHEIKVLLTNKTVYFADG